ncbi:MAG: hypothetical protein ABID38_04430 [Candidatus Diapherotrites archaeon]
MKFRLFGTIILISLILLLSGCISGELNERVNADGSIHRLMEIDKTGLLMNASCDSLKNMAQNSAEVSVADLENFQHVCRETDSQVIVEFDLQYGDEQNPVEIIEREDGEYLRYESELIAVTVTKITMPSKITSHNGELLNDNTVAFKGAEVFSDMGNILDEGQENTGKTIYVESKKPESDLLVFIILIIGGIVILGLVIMAGLFFVIKKK